MNTALKQKQDAGLNERIATLIAGMDWARVGTDLDGSGWALLKGLLTAKECETLAALYDDEKRFRSTIVMARARLRPRRVQVFRLSVAGHRRGVAPALYARLVPIANRWNEAMKIAVRYPNSARRIHRALPRGRPDAADAAAPELWRRRLQLPAPGPLWRARLPAAGGDPAVGAGRGFHRRRVRADRAAAAHAVARRGGAAQARPCRGVRGPSSPGAGHARVLSRHHAARRQRRCAPAIARPPASSFTTRSSLDARSLYIQHAAACAPSSVRRESTRRARASKGDGPGRASSRAASRPPQDDGLRLAVDVDRGR